MKNNFIFEKKTVSVLEQRLSITENKLKDGNASDHYSNNNSNGNAYTNGTGKGSNKTSTVIGNYNK